MVTVLAKNSGRTKVTKVVVKTTSRNTARITVFRIRMIRQ